MDRLRQDLTCPLCLELFRDPVTVPCCGKAFEREELVKSLAFREKCPLCNGDLSEFDAEAAAKNVLLAGLVDTLQEQRDEPVDDTSDHLWTCTATPVVSNKGMAEVVVNIQRSKFQTRPALFIAVLDRSGSMSGQASRQVSAALTHIECLAKANSNVKLVMLSYGSDCTEIHTAADYKINGGTNFRSAFNMVDTVLRRYICSNKPEDANLSNNVSAATIVLMTDGQDGSGNRSTLAPEFREMLKGTWKDSPVTVHTVGFSNACDRELLEAIRTSGNIEGFYRYAEPQDDDDTLCQKLSSIFEISSQSSTVPVEIILDGVSRNVRFPINSSKHGSHKMWIDLASSNLQMKINTQLDDNITLPIKVLQPTEFVFQRWLSHMCDEMAVELLELSKTNLTQNLRDLTCCLLSQKVSAIHSHTDDVTVIETLNYLSTQIDQLRIGKQVNLGKLSDLRFGSLFAAKKKQPKKAEEQIYCTQTLRKEDPVIDDAPYFEKALRNYSRNNENAERNAIQEAISNQFFDDGDLSDMLSSCSIDDILETDAYGNNTLMFAAYCGHSAIVANILKHFPTVDLELENPDGETALTLAVKKRGFHHTLGCLLDAGAKIPPRRTKSLERYCIDNGFRITADIVSKFADFDFKVDTSMEPDYVLYTFNRAVASTHPWDPQQFLSVALSKQMTELVDKLLSSHDAKPTIDMLIEFCIPPKPDHPRTDDYLALCDMLLSHSPELVHQKTEPELESPLFAASRKGSLPHVKYFIQKGVEIDSPNHKGNTPLWVAAFQRYPCIIEELVNCGADINHENEKGNTPLYGPCTRGNAKVAELLVSYGACVEHINSNGDTLVLICCRNGHADVLRLLLSYVDLPFVNKKAHIDGFDAIMACAEQDSADCITALHEFSVDLNSRTDPDNQIIASATPLHIAAYYNRAAAAKRLLSLNADANAQDHNGQTPAHIAVIQGNVQILRLLKTFKADLNLVDNLGNTPLTYVRDNVEIRNILIDPVTEVLVRLVKGGFSEQEESTAISILQSHTGVIGCLEPSQVVDVRDVDGATPLLHAVIRGRLNLSQLLVGLGADANACTARGMTCIDWAVWNKNPRLLSVLYTGDSPLADSPRITNLKRAAAAHGAAMLFLGLPPKGYSPIKNSGILERMSEFLNTPMVTFDPPKLLTSDKSNIIHRSIPSNEDFSKHQDQLSHSLWDAKILMIEKIASGNEQLSPQQVVSIAMATNNEHITGILNKQMLTNQLRGVALTFASSLYYSLKQLPKYEGEVYIGSSTANRKLYTKGQTFGWNFFASGSTLWKVSLEGAPSFATNSRRGIVFIVKSLTGRFVGSHSNHPSDSEVLFLPGTTFTVTNWYHGDIIALGQENIREHSFGVKEKDDERAPLSQLMASDKSLIIELTEQSAAEPAA
eukprot:TRINITY_DN16854_c0_g1_i1.p1 TRINITY_DN16854_c0_g1~~TRINITY_DN16854_c0_g1_i1.p1  ORF type:complete len:1402 (+),score=282.26 TRINITY_DN16854_c0_g1_i1:59-4264(+)